MLHIFSIGCLQSCSDGLFLDVMCRLLKIVKYLTTADC